MTIVTYNSARYVGLCLRYLLASETEVFDIVVVDNASTDNTRDTLEQFSPRVRTIYNQVNIGFAAGQNQAIKQTRTPWVLVLNPDVRVTEGFLARLLEAGSRDSSAGTVCGKLLFMNGDFRTPFELGEPPRIDSTGIYFTPELRHFDRGSKTLDRGQFEREEHVFGATGAAAMYRRAMMEDVFIGGEFFDEDFFAYREDADVSWRAQLFGWTCVYTPSALAFHVRSVLPENRRQVSALVNMHSVKNRFLMRIKNVDREIYSKHWWRITQRDLLIFAACFLYEWSSLPAFSFVFRRWRKIWRRRQEIMERRRVGPSEIARWFA